MLWPDERQERRERIKEDLIYAAELLGVWIFFMIIIMIILF